MTFSRIFKTGKGHLPVLLGFLAVLYVQAGVRPTPRQFPIGSLNRMEDLPAGRLRTQVERLPAVAQERALRWLRSFHFTEADLESLHVDSSGGVLYVDTLVPRDTLVKQEQPVLSSATVPVTPFPATLIFHSKPGAPNVLFINFNGETVTNTQWNTDVGRTEITAAGFSSDADDTTFSDAEQAAIKRIWQRIAEDYAPFDIDVTTERPLTFTTKTAHALITRTTDTKGEPNPHSTAGGVAYINVFGTLNYARYRPAWIYYDNLWSEESHVAEAASHEIGHNLGLSHDGTASSDYYGGHGSGDSSWAPLMGSGYSRNVSQWSKGEYYLANNTQDDLATMASKISYRGDDHGDTAGLASRLVLVDGTNVMSTTPEPDPANSNPSNKGVLERNTDLDVFSFVTGAGPVNLSVKPWSMASGTRGGNLDVVVRLYDETGALLLTNNPPNLTTAAVQTNLGQGRYFLHVSNSGAGDPFGTSPTGYTPYGSIGQYFISGYITRPTLFVARPVAELKANDLAQANQGAHQIRVTYSDDVGLDVSTMDSNDILVTGPNGYHQLARFISADVGPEGSSCTATYSVLPDLGETWTTAANGTYTVWMQTNQVADLEQAWVGPGVLGKFQVTVPMVLYYANMDVDPGWTLEPQWQYGAPSYGSFGPNLGFSGTKIIGYNLGGNYTGNLAATSATTPLINCSGASSLTLRFKRWLRTRPNDAVAILVSTNGITWEAVWSTLTAISDYAWQEVQYTLPAHLGGSSSLRLRWSLASNRNQEDIGWNIDDVEVLGGGALDTAAPVALLSAASLTQAGSPTHACSVTFSDSTAVRLASIDSADLAVTGPNGYSNVVEFVGVDLPSDGSPVTATYSISAPDDTWKADDNGEYLVSLLEGAVEDVLDNATTARVLGSFTVSIDAESPALVITSLHLLDSQMTVRAQGIAGREYSIEASSDLQSWSLVSSIIADTEGVIMYRESVSNAPGARFYRVVVPQ